MARSLGVRFGGMALIISLPVMSPLAASRAVAAGDYPRVLQVQSDQPRQVSVDVVVPPLLAGVALPVSAFEVRVNGGRSLVTSAGRLTPADLRIMLVIDAAVSPAVLEAQQGAARELIFELPAQARVGVVAGGPDPALVAAPGTDRAATVRALSAVRAQPPDDAVDVTASLEVALRQLATGRGTDVVVAVDWRPIPTAMPFEVSRTALDRRTAIYSIVPSRPPPGYLDGLPELSGGRVLEVTGPRLLLNAFDTVRSELQGRYRVGYSGTDVGATVELVVAARGVRAATTFAVAGVAGPAPPPTDPAGARPAALFAGVLVVIAISAVLVGRLSTPLPT